MADLGPASNGFARVLDVYDYVNVEGRLLYQVVRRADKSFAARHWIGDEVGSGRGDSDTVLYRLPRLSHAIRNGAPIYVVEGEKDVHALETLGAVATCNPGGAKKWRTPYTARLLDAHVIIVADQDPPGREHAVMVGTAIKGKAASVKVVTAAAGKDAADHVAAGRGLDDFIPVTAEQLLQWAFRSDADRVDDSDEPTIKWQSLEEFVQDPEASKPPVAVVPHIGWRGRVTLLAAREGYGKSTLMAAAAAAVTTGSEFLGDPTVEGKVLWARLEEHPGDLARRALEFQTDKSRLVFNVHLNDPLEDMTAAIGEHQPVLVVVDTLHALASLRGITEAGSSAQWQPILMQLAELARDGGAAVVLLHHARKSDGAYRDSTAIGAAVDVVLTIDSCHDSHRRIKATKARWSMPNFTVALANGVYSLASNLESLKERVLAFIKGHPGCGRSKVYDSVKGRREKKQAAIDELIATGAVEERRSGNTRSLWPLGGRDADGAASF